MGLCTKITLYILCVAYLTFQLIDVYTHPHFPKVLSRLKDGSNSASSSSDGGQKNRDRVSDQDTATCPEIHSGMILAATHSLDASAHSGHIILLVSYYPGAGSLGLVLNGPRIPVGKACSVLYGGPQSSEKRYQLHSDASLSYSRKVVNGLYFGGDMRITPAGDVAVFYGATNWVPGALEQEISRGDWRVLGEATAEAILENSKTS